MIVVATSVLVIKSDVLSFKEGIIIITFALKALITG